ncbi:uncharacterized protein LOC141853057 [Brevipalpus obovatus]|uniref:uncharacterized protein LOC141853057 n=1 Tax=Brevipalpus obovatus TaxID=246614 RepID=UPI003D9E2DDD
MSSHRSNQIGSRFTEPPVYCTPGSNLPNNTANQSGNLSTFTNLLPDMTVPDLQKVLAQFSNQPISPGLSDNGTRDSLDSLRSNGTDTYPKTVDGILQQLDELRKERESHLKLVQTLQEKETRLFLQLRILLQRTNSGNALPTTQEILNSLEPAASPSQSPPLATTQNPHKSFSKTQINPVEMDEDVPEPPPKKPGPRSKTMPGVTTPKKPSTESERGIGKRPAPNKPSSEAPTKKITPLTTGVKQSRPAKITAKKRTMGSVFDTGVKSHNDEISNRTSSENPQIGRNSSESPSINKEKDGSRQEASTSNRALSESVQRGDMTTGDRSEEPENEFKFLERTLAQIESTDEAFCGVSISQAAVPLAPPSAPMGPGSPVDIKPVIAELASTMAHQPQHDLPGTNVTPPRQIEQEKIDPPIKIKTEKE